MLAGTVDGGSPLKQPDPGLSDAQSITPPAAVVAELNRRFQDKDEATPYFTMLYGVVNTRTGRARMCQAGHPSPFRVSPDGSFEKLGHGGFPVGLLPAARYEDIEFSLRPGDRLFCYSDGVSECTDPQQRAYGSERLITHLVQTCRRPLPESLTELRARLEEWRNGEAFDDDVSLIAIEFQPRTAISGSSLDTQQTAVPLQAARRMTSPEPPRTTP